MEFFVAQYRAEILSRPKTSTHYHHYRFHQSSPLLWSVFAQTVLPEPSVRKLLYTKITQFLGIT